MTDNSDTPSRPGGLSDPVQFMQNMAQVMQQAAEIMVQQASKRPAAVDMASDLPVVANAFQDLARSYLAHPQKLAEAQLKLWQGYSEVWQRAAQQALGARAEPAADPLPGDRRFRDAEWDENPAFSFVKNAYLTTSRWAAEVVANASDLDEPARRRAAFFVDQMLNALAPTNFPLTNPKVLRATLESNGRNLVEGMRRFGEDVAAGKGELRIRQTDLDAFVVGRNLATTPGKVIFQNDIIQLIQYAPSTDQVFKRPLLIVPPWINKFYVLDLTAQKSFIRWAVAQGLTVFVISWVNPDERLADKTFADYMQEGVLAAVDAVLHATGEDDLNALGYCGGGTLLSATLAYMRAKGDERVRSATLLATQVDFEKAGDLLVFIEEQQIAALERTMAEKGYLDGSKMFNTFNILRANDLFWSYVVSNYLLGRDPAPFDMLYWNADATRMPAALHSYLLRECYLNNRLSKGELMLAGVRLDLSEVNIPIYNLAAREDHIAPLPSVFRVGRSFGGTTRLVVAGSGHIAGVINPPDAGRYSYWISDQDADNPEEWLANATEHKGSWWPDWAAWLAAHGGPKLAARQPGDGPLKPIEDAPGSYVLVRSD
ncbi:PHA/PHB synthase family protein [Rhodoligotrophos defluvii]|uniref:PHA/PHB synthase family protein n=1 Tax=Rhodoligotrophos defluvii TaxID=2561934 RepID=UPI0010C9A54B|nr:class I poly(R)-hydroxyalkanoic acid synthase [Rhodoligotrophos defluvii]